MHDSPSVSCGVSLRRLFPDAAFFGAEDIVVSGCCDDSRVVQPGELFSAIVGPNADGHDFVYEACFRGAAAILAERYLATDGKPVCVVGDSRVAYGRLRHALAGDPSQAVRVIGVTGTAGKTTTAVLIDSVLTSAGYRVGSMNGLAHFDGAQLDGPAAGTAKAGDIAGALSRMVGNKCDFAVLEASSQALSQHRLAGLTLDMACVTNVRYDHLDYHTTVQNYRDTKARMFDYLRPAGAAVLNLDDRFCADYLREMNGPALSVGMIATADVTAVVVERVTSEQTFLLSAGGETAPVRTRIIGDQHVVNCLLAAGVGLVCDVPLVEIARGLERVDRVPGRMERLECGQPFGVFIDAAQTPYTLGVALEALREVTSGRLICVFGAEGERSCDLRPLAGQTVEALADLVVITDDNPRGEDPRSIANDLLRGFDAKENVVVLHDRAKAIYWALAHAAPGDCVLIAGKGHDDRQYIGRQCYWFEDREVACQWLYDEGQRTGFAGDRRSNAA